MERFYQKRWFLPLVCTILVLAVAIPGLIIPHERRVDNIKEYKICYPEDMSEESFKAVSALYRHFRKEDNIRIKLRDDVLDPRVNNGEAPTDTLEILVGQTNRRESARFRLGKDDYAIYTRNNRLVINGGSPEALMKAVNLYIELYDREDGYWFPGKDILYRAEYPYEKMTINGTDISKYTIVYTKETEPFSVFLSEAIADACGAVLPRVPAKTAVGEYEIRLGNFDSVARQTPEAPAGQYKIETEGKNLLLYGDGLGGVYAGLLKFMAMTVGEGEKLALDFGAPQTGAAVKTASLATNLPALGSMSDRYDLELTAENVFRRFEMAVEELPDEIDLVEGPDPNDYPLSLRAQVYVSPYGSDTGAGTKEAPFATLGRAMEYMSEKSGGVIWMMEGEYAVPKTIEMSRLHSGTVVSPLFIKAYEGADVSLTSNKEWENAFVPVDPDSDPVAARLPEEAKAHVLSASLSDLGLFPRDMAAISLTTGPAKLYVAGEEYTTARFPNDTGDIHDLLYFTRVDEQGRCTVMEGSDLYASWLEEAANRYQNDINRPIGWQIEVLSAFRNNKTTAEADAAQKMADEILSWVNTGHIYYYGSTFEGWEFGFYNLAYETEIDGVKNYHYNEDGLPLLGGFREDKYGAGDPAVTVYDENGTPSVKNGHYFLKSMSPNSWGCKHSTNSPAGHNTFYLFNAIEALDAPGEWFYDEDTGVVYLYPTENYDGNEIRYSGSNSYPLIRGSSLSYVVFDGIDIAASNGCGIQISNSNNVYVQNANVSHTSSYGVELRECTDCAVLCSDFSCSYNDAMLLITDNTGFYQLAPSRNVVQNCVFHDPAATHPYAISAGGTQMVISHNYFRNTMITAGNIAESIIEYNRFDGGAKDVVDGGMIYVAGWESRGNHFRYNLFEKFNAAHNAVYNDGQASGNYTYGNIICTIGSKAEVNNAWYSSSGFGNVCYQNTMILRSDNRATVEMENIEYSNVSDRISQSGLFYYYWSDDGYSMNNPSISVHPALDFTTHEPVGGIKWSQSLAGHWWYGRREKEVMLYTTRCDFTTWQDRFPGYMNYIYTLDLIGSAASASIDVETGERISTYEVKYFYVPSQLCGKEYTYYGAPVGTVFTIPEYEYLDASGHKIRVPQHTEEVLNEWEGVTLSYEEIAAMERAFRGPCCNVISENVILGGAADWAHVIADDVKNYYGYNDTAATEKNFHEQDYKKIVNFRLDTADDDYGFTEEGVSRLEAYFGEDFFEYYMAVDPDKAGVTFPIDYTDYLNE